MCILFNIVKFVHDFVYDKPDNFRVELAFYVKQFTFFR